MWDGAGGDCADHLRSAFYDAGMFGGGADHEAGYVVEEDDGCGSDGIVGVRV